MSQSANSAPEAAATNTLSIREVGKTFGTGADVVSAIDSVSLDIRQGEFISIVGPSGCGKSTLLQIVAGLVNATSGEVLQNGRAVTEPPPGMVYLFQQYSRSLFPWMTVVQNVSFAIDHHKDLDRKEIASICERFISLVGLGEFSNRYPWELSGGMQQRVAIARALAAQPDVLLLDEPFSAVDALTRMDLHSLILRVWKEIGVTVMLVTHDADEAVFLSDRVALLASRPSTVVEVFDNELPRPRDPVESRQDPRFLSLRHELLRRLLER
ncbi:MAG: ABC transporter ATP-binding protein [Aquisalimonadaceae bacterium]